MNKQPKLDAKHFLTSFIATISALLAFLSFAIVLVFAAPEESPLFFVGFFIIIICAIALPAYVAVYSKRFLAIQTEKLCEVSQGVMHKFKLQYLIVSQGNVEAVGNQTQISMQKLVLKHYNETLKELKWSDVYAYYLVVVNKMPYILLSQYAINVANEHEVSLFSGVALLDTQLARLCISACGQSEIDETHLNKFSQQIQELNSQIKAFGKNKGYYTANGILLATTMVAGIVSGVLLHFRVGLPLLLAPIVAVIVCMLPLVLISNWINKKSSKSCYLINPAEGFVYFKGFRHYFYEWSNIIKIFKQENKVVMFVYQKSTNEDAEPEQPTFDKVFLQFDKQAYDMLAEVKRNKKLDFIID